MDVAFCFMEQVVVRNAIGHLRFAPNPIAELALSTMIVRYPDQHPFHARWFTETAEARRQVGEERILALINEKKWILDVLLRHPTRRGASFDQEVRALDVVDARVFRHDAEVVWGTPPRLMGRTDAAVKAFVLETVSDYWRACFARYWPAFKAVLDADVTYRGAELTARGVAEAVTGAIPGFVVRGNDILVPLRRGTGWEADAAPQGTTFLPTLVKWGTNFPNDPESDLVFTYRARGRGRLQSADVDARPGLIGVLGRTRTELLISLDEPASSTAIPIFMGVTTTAANQHLRALARAGLLQTSRFGRYVLYERTQVADDLVAAAE